MADPIVLGYYPAWSTGVQPADIAYHQFTHLAHAFASPRPDGSVGAGGNLPSRDLTGRAHAAGVKVLLSLGGGGSGSAHFAAVMRNSATAERFVTETVALVRNHGYDGLDCDWEFPEDEEGAANLVKLVAAYRDRLPTTLLTMAVNAGPWYARWFDHERLLPLFDFLNVMCYDFHGPWGDHAGHNAPLHPAAGDPDGATMNTAAGMAFWHEVKRFPKAKLVVGIPSYGRSFLAASWHEPVTGKSPREYVSWNAVRDLLAEGWRREWDAATQVPFLRKDGVGELISYEDEESAARKGAWARAEGYRGIFFWEITQDAREGRHVLVSAARSAFVG